MSRVALAVLIALPLLAGCGHPVQAVAHLRDDVPASAADLERLVVATVPSGLPRLPDDDLTPRAGQKSLDDLARYAGDPDRERIVLGRYGYRFGWERFWGTGSGPMTSVFVYRFGTWLGAAAVAGDLARNDADFYRAMLEPDPSGLPGDCWWLQVDSPDAGVGLAGPASIAWCAHGAFTVSVTAEARTPSASVAEVRAALSAQLARLPVG